MAVDPGAEQKEIEYDLNGSTIKEETGTLVSATREYIYDAQDRMVEVKDNSVSVAKYAYDPMGRRIWRQAGAEITWFLYSSEGLIQELASANSEIRTYGWNPRGIWGTDTVWQKDANGVFLTNNDHLYTTDVLTGAVNGDNKWASVRESFGKTTVRPNAGTDYLMRFPGQWEETIIDLNQNLWREYFNSTGRYTTKDWWQFFQVYAYVNSSPIILKDPVGLEPCKDCCKNVEWNRTSGKKVDKVGGTIRCCNGYPKVCLRPDYCKGAGVTESKGEIACIIATECTLVHEDIHRKYHTNCKNLSDGELPYLTDSYNKNSAECDAYSEGARCLRKFHSRCLDQKCKDIVLDELVNELIRGEGFCELYYGRPIKL